MNNHTVLLREFDGVAATFLPYAQSAQAQDSCYLLPELFFYVFYGRVLRLDASQFQGSSK